MKTNIILCALCGLILLWQQVLYAQIITLRDPTQPVIVDVIIPESVKEHAEEYILHSIIHSPTRRLAFINDQYVKEGDMIGDSKVEMIEKNFVVLSRSGQKKTIYLFDLGNWEKST